MTIHTILSRHYHMPGAVLTEVQPGWSALAYRVEVGGQRYFLKVYDKTRPSSKVWIEGIDRYMPAALWLWEHSPLRGRIPHVVPTADGSYKCEDVEHLYILFDWIDGITTRDNPLTPPQFSELSQVIAELHNIPQGSPAFSQLIRERYDIPFYESLMMRLGNREESIPRAYLPVIAERLHQLSEAASVLSAQDLSFVLCHNDIHGWNVITQGDRLVLIDWEGLRFAPPESDLFMFKYEGYWQRRWDAFYAVYKRVHPHHEINETAMRFFQLRRRLEDIDAFIDNIVLDNTSAEAQTEARQSIIRECGLL